MAERATQQSFSGETAEDIKSLLHVFRQGSEEFDSFVGLRMSELQAVGVQSLSADQAAVFGQVLAGVDQIAD